MNYIFRNRDNQKLNDNWLGVLPDNLGSMWLAYFNNNKKRSIK